MINGYIGSLLDVFQCYGSANGCRTTGYGSGFAFEEIPSWEGHDAVIDIERSNEREQQEKSESIFVNNRKNK